MNRKDLIEELLSSSAIYKYEVKGVSTYRRRYKRINNLNEDLKVKLNEFLSEFRSEEEGWYCLLHDIDPPRCKYCGDIAEFYSDKRSNASKYKTLCSSDTCKSKFRKEVCSNPETKRKREETCIKKYGFAHAISSPEIRKKRDDAYFEKTGYRSPLQNPEIREKLKNTNLKKYGYEHATQAPSVKEKTKNTNLRKYGKEYIGQVESMKRLAKETSKKHWGVENPSQSDIIKKKKENTFLKNYGVSHYKKSEIADQRYRSACLKKYGVPNVSQKHIKNLEIWLDNEKFKNWVLEEYNNKRRLLLLAEEAAFFNLSPVSGSLHKRLKDLDLEKYFDIRESNFEIKIEELLQKLNLNYIRNNRSIIYPLELDFYLPDQKIAIEINDIYSHNSSIGVFNKKPKSSTYHLNKTLKCREKGIRLIHLWEWEIQGEETSKTLSWLKDQLICDKIYYARNLKIKEIKDNKVIQNFLNENHLQGYIKSETSIGLYEGDNLIEIMTFGPSRFNKNYEKELLRLCSKVGCRVPGGAEKILKYYQKNFHPKSIISYCDFSKYSGDIYKRLGMEEIGDIRPNLIWCNYSLKHFKGSTVASLGPDKLLKLNYGKNVDNNEIMEKEGYLKIYNCGNRIFAC